MRQRAKPAPPPSGNRLLAALPPDDRERLRCQGEWRELTPRQTLIVPGRRIDYVYFLEDGIVSLLQPLQDGAMIEIALVGREGLIGVPVVLGAPVSQAEAIVQTPGHALRLRASVLRQEMTRHPALLDLLLRYVLALHVQVAQAVACNGRHPVPKRLARWLLAAGDRIGGEALALSHETLAEMLGMRRASVTVALGALRRAGLIHNSPGHIAILDAKELEASACECYRVVKDEYARLLP
ncbi:MAG TPA: Crp/Fnr family transcriptional regulator [Stellaceae bacterium]|nr:Crp/Fnr family transcriptional regulator [Stellaceae bacterium]